ncbi:phosphate ABC transporter permease PstA [Rhizobium leguminosarum]|uniref:Phosphate transport system permease protein PstA n=1 Tax=Rhizobium beringeri TaxID=3019934 RepID=A0ABY1XU13_9HYPH|nr:MULTISPECIES: phosphate ABC transporter permease PstA [Rhizobium]MBY5459426.1 phosphate ABC transporter permease PstA [Rhizobium leguminosarum]NKL60891.1 phosphate ABC transporter permease PstA [Rhizobium leguminosarum bv. viciae]TBC72596.1 phosphate ABC transporter permease PstA [Rhizobium leguminosarum]TBD04141.1 phosphate ABC transporter permease PstA [Rhizobium leguminosarum]TBE70480.1 phosphate ABC transporter permease PstA [Rhizobium beringeri]
MAVSNSLYRYRQMKSAIALTLATAATAIGLIFLVWILWTTLINGFSALSPKLVTEMTPPPGEDGGLANAFMGSLMIVALAVVIGTPIGILAGTYLAEFSRGKKIGDIIRFVNDILLSAPSIIIGLFVYELVVRQTGHFSGYAGGIALAFIFLPVVVRTTDEMLRLVPDVMREAALSLGIPRWKVTVAVLYRAAGAGILTGVLLAIARISGETAPLLFTALNNQYWSTDMSEPMANIPVVIFQYAMSPYDEWHTLAWAGAFVMTAIVLLLSVGSRAILNRRNAK